MKKLLIIEDDRILLETASEFLREEGYEVLKATDGLKGIEMAMKNNPNLILCDIYMPGVDGYEVYLRLQSTVSTSQIPFIFMTAKAEKEDIRFGMQMGADDYITKPIDFLQLKKTIKVRLNKFEQSILRSELKYHTLFEFANDAILIVKPPSCIILDANQACLAMLGYHKNEILGLRGDEIVGGTREEQNATGWQEITGPESYSLKEILLRNKNGRLSPVQVSGTTMEIAGENLFLIIARDISELKEKEQALKESEQRLREIVDLTNDWIWEITPDWKYSYVSQKIFDILGYQPEEMIGKSPFDFLLPEDVSLVKESVRTVVHQYKPINALVNRAHHKDGSLIFLETSGVPIFDENGVYKGYRGADRDITLRKLYERQLIIAKEKAEESDRLKSSILANMSHELRTPLNGILGFAEILKEELRDSDYQSMIENIHNSGKRLMSTLNSIITLSQLESGKINVTKKEVRLETSITSVVKSMESLALEKMIRINTIGIKPFLVNTDDHLVKQLLRQILDNSIKFTDHGEITIATHHAIESGMKWVVIKISDTGIGIDKDYFDLIFQEFRQVSEGFGRQYQGSGIGLTISKKIIDLLEGMITVESTPGKGSGFSIWLPDNLEPGDNQDPESKSTGLNQVNGINTGSKTMPLILLVEDNTVNKELAEFFLRKVCILEYAADAATAINMVQAKQYEAILMDINLGYGMNGIEATQAIRQLPGYQKTPIIAVTGYTMEEDKEKLLSAGCTSHISKPFTKQSLVQLIEKTLKQA